MDSTSFGQAWPTHLSLPLKKIDVSVVSLVLLDVDVAKARGEGLGLGIADPGDLGCNLN